MACSIRQRMLLALSASLTAVAAMFPVPVLAGPILADDGIVYIERGPSSLNTTAVTDPAHNPAGVGYIAHDGGQLKLWDYDNEPLTTHDPNPDWWNAPGLAYTTGTAGMLVEFTDLDVTGFTFNIGASDNSRAWIRAYYDDGQGHTLSTQWFTGIGPASTPSFGVYVSDPGVSCARITRVEVDPTFEWGVGNFGVAESGCDSIPVSAPGSGLLVMFGLLGFALASGLLTARQPVRPWNRR